MRKLYLPILIALFAIIGIYTFMNLTDDKKTPDPSIQPPIIEEEPEVEVPPPKVDEDQQILESMTLEEKIGQLLIVGYKEAQPENVQSLIEDYHVGGIILFSRNYSDVASLLQVTNQLQSWNDINKLPLFISIDEEGGIVSRLPNDATKFPDPRILGEIDDPALTHRVGSTIGKELRALGINMNFAPVMDVVETPNNKLLYKRAFGGNPEVVSTHGIEFIKGLEDEGVMAVPKHFPGHGDTVVDSHGELPIIMIDRETLLSRDVIPFIKAIDSGAEGIMVGHIAFPLIDDSELPATKSEIIVEGILREHMGYDGLIITDDIEMLGYAKNTNELNDGVLKSLQAGVDLFIIGHTFDKQVEVINTIKDAIENNIISEDRIDESVLRIINAKNKYGIDLIADLDGVKKIIGSEEHQQVLDEVLTRKP